jgi:hypothetical protein
VTGGIIAPGVGGLRAKPLVADVGTVGAALAVGGLNPPLPSVVMALGAFGLNPAVPRLGSALVGTGLSPIGLLAPLAAPVKRDVDPVPPNSVLVSASGGLI